ncbi:bulb-type lectin domain-containing protein [Xylaria sp. CBS 124048]|nr:bulb-type lectin domain-containing protein [Xylaria sp. CBS 124048]
MSPSGSHSTLGNGEWLVPGQSLFSTDGSVEFKMQQDGKIAVYWGGKCQWQNTADQFYDRKGVIMQEDGNFCMYDTKGTATWHTNTATSQAGSTCIIAVQNDGNVVMYKGTPVWASNTQKK